jgi:hypothetical protein
MKSVFCYLPSWQIISPIKFNDLSYIIVTDISRLLFYGVSVIDKSLLCLVNASDDFSLYAAFSLLFLNLFIYLLFLQVKNVTVE